jgi:membrane peptidoglycan carboxypeptidase
VNDQPRRRHGRPEPAWPGQEAPDGPKAEQPQERTGFWSPLWEDDEDDAPAAPAAPSGGPAWPSGDDSPSRSNGNGRGADPAWPSADGQENGHGPRRPSPAPSPRRTPRPTPRPTGPAWPGAEAAAEAPPAGARPPAGPPPRVPRPSRPAGPPPPVPSAPDLSEEPTELLPPASGRMGPEPELLTHREIDDYGEPDPLPEEAFLAEELDDEDEPLTDDDRRKRRRKVWRRVRRAMYVLIALMIFGPVIAFFIAYQYVDVPNPDQIAASQGQIALINYADDTDDNPADNPRLARLLPASGENREMVTYEDLQKAPNVLHAVFSAEDKEFMTNPGFDITGVLNAGWNQVTGGSGGGSTITQQYIKKATSNEEKTLTRKALEVVQAYKMNNTYSKPQIITAYLNTVYFGKGAYGISAAAKAYYNKDFTQLSESEAALLAGMIQTPSRFDEPAYMKKRWNFVSDQMVKNGWYDAAKREAAEFPPLYVKPDDGSGGKLGPEGHLRTQILEELENKAGITEQELNENGYTVETTVYQDIQQTAIDSVRKVMGGEPANLKTALVAVNPANGDILAYYGGEDGVGLDWAAARQEPGSSFKPFDLVAFLEQGRGLGETFDGSSPRVFDGREVRNSENSNKCGKNCPVSKAMELSINTVFYDMVLHETGTPAVARAAEAAGVRSPLMPEGGGNPDANISIGGGQTAVTTVDMASAYATFAADGVYTEPHFVKRVLDRDGNVVYEANPQSKTDPFKNDKGYSSAQISNNVTESLRPVLSSSDLECADKRECAGKTGTHQLGKTGENSKAWMVGYTPQVSAAVSMSDEKGGAITNANGKKIYGSGLPGEIWKTFMDDYLDGAEKIKFPKYDPIGKNKPDKDESSASQPSNTGGQTTTTTTQTETTTTDETTTTTDDDWPIPGGPGGPGEPGNFQGREPE